MSEGPVPQRPSNPLISVVVPVYRESGNLTRLVAELDRVTDQIPSTRWEYVFVNDGSPDDSLLVLAQLTTTHPRVRVVDLSRNFGKEIALTAGMQFVRGDAVVCMDADLQHPPELLVEMIRSWRSGIDVVATVRETSERQPLVRKVGSSLFYWIMARLSDVEVVAKTTDFRLLDRRVVEAFKLIGEREPMFRSLVDWLGFSRQYLTFAAPERHSGQSVYSYRKLWALALNGFISHSSAPLRMVGYLGLLITFASAGSLVWMSLAETLVSPRFYYTPLAKVVVFNTLLIGLVLAAMGVLALYVAKIYSEVLRRPSYAVRQVLESSARPVTGLAVSK